MDNILEMMYKNHYMHFHKLNYYILENFTAQDIDIYMNENLPKRKGAALILDDKSEKIYPVHVYMNILCSKVFHYFI